MSGLLVMEKQQAEYATMTISDDFLKAEHFQHHTHRHSFVNGETQEQRTAWVLDVETKCQAAHISYIVHETVNDEGLPCYVFGFPSRLAQIAFTLNTFDDIHGEFIYTHGLHGVSPTYKRAFFMAAEAHLAVLRIQHEWEERGDDIVFYFEKWSDQLMLELLLENGTIDSSARGIEQALLFRNKYEFSPIGPLGAPGSNL